MGATREGCSVPLGDGVGGSLEALREQNRLLVIDVLRRNGTATRGDIARITRLSRTTVASIVADLQARGLVAEPSGGTRSGARGRPAALLKLDPSAGAALGVDFGHRHVRIAVADLSSTVLAEEVVPLDVDNDADNALDVSTDLVAHVLGSAAVARERVIGAGMGLPGPFDGARGLINSTTILPGWVGRDPVGELASRLDVQVEADNDANLGALAELMFGAGRGHRDAVYVKLSTGIGAGLVFRGSIYRGATGIAGELGHVQVERDGAACSCGGRGCLQTVAGIPRLLALASEAHGSDLTVQGLIDLVHAGDFAARRIVGEAGRAVGRVLADLCNLINPEVIIVGGDLSVAGEPLLAGIRESIDRHALPGAAEAVQVKPAVLGERAEVLGALALVIGDTERLRSAGLAALSGVG
jgi:predicted NBD/HSP70 family sugar kinase